MSEFKTTRTALPILTMVGALIVVIASFAISASSSSTSLTACWKREDDWKAVAERQKDAMATQSDAIKKAMEALKKQGAVLEEQADVIRQLRRAYQ